MMEIGLLNSRVEIQAYTETEDDTSGTIRVWTTINTVWANINPVKGLVTLDTKQIDQTVTHTIIIRYLLRVTTENWILFKGRRFRIRSVRNLKERNRYLELLCEEDSKAIQSFTVNESAVGDPLRELIE